MLDPETAACWQRSSELIAANALVELSKKKKVRFADQDQFQVPTPYTIYSNLPTSPPLIHLTNLYCWYQGNYLVYPVYIASDPTRYTPS